MAPRRGSGGFSYGGDNPWNDEVLLSLDRYSGSYKTYFFVRFAFDALSLLAFVIFLIWACTIRKRTLPKKTIIFALLSFICSEVVHIVWGALYIADAEVTRYYLITLMLWNFFLIFGICLTFHVFWKLIHEFLGRLTHSSKPSSGLVTLHGTFYFLALLLGFAQVALYISAVVYAVISRYSNTAYIWSQLKGAMYIVYWVLSMEILGFMIYVVVKAGNHRFVSKLPAIALINAAVCWFAICFAWAIINIQHGIIQTIAWPVYLDAVQAIVQFIFSVGTFTGILLCCSKWHRLGDGLETFTVAPYPPASPQYPSGDYPPTQFQSRLPDEYSQEVYPPTQQQPYGAAPYRDYSNQPTHYQTHRAPSPM
ncbi:hypothetical protein N7457_004835 [Penicillium paradoxum]|uniref:uncharacterized protein n=1 Tax=Penicillium paradoxum TaxID=176176 RepID=UPI002547DF1C|nr:uncharacterized protein N7457_004835 [Penicillium paradoxum]KAJ5783061.1 hypothetical protein N7457_004835 [Penicillium paradoxum]